MSNKPVVLIVGASGHTGVFVTKALLEDGGFRVAILVRAQSANKPVIQEYKAAGAELRIGDIGDAPEKLEASLQGIDILISLVMVFLDQKPLLLAAKKAGVGRVIPSDFGPTIPKGVVDMHDVKLSIREYVKEIGVPYTIIEAGWWIQQLLPYPHGMPDSIFNPKSYVGDRKKQVLWTVLPTTALFVRRIINDPRTLNQTVMTSDGQANLEEFFAVAEKVSGEDFSDYPRVPDEVIEKTANGTDVLPRILAQYYRSFLINEDNTMEKAISRGALDARELYPDVPVVPIEEAAKGFYANPPVTEYDL